jgi:lipopolysaccharide biosynthesis regulator YciM
MVLCFVLGAAAVALLWGWRGVQDLVSDLVDRRSSRRDRENEASYRRGLELLLHGRPERALTVMNEILAIDPDHGSALMTGADILRSLARPREAAELRSRRIASAPDDIAALLALADDQREAGELEQSAATLQKVVDLRPRQALAASEKLREVLLESGDYERALAAHERLARMRDEAGRSLPGEELERAGIESRWALQQADHGKERDAQALARKVLRRHPRFVPAWIALARAQALSGDETGAVDSWVEGFEKTNEASLLVEAEQYFQESRHEGDAIERAGAALRAFKRFAACSGSRPVAVAFLGKLYVRHEMLDEAATAFESVRERFPENPTFAYYSARIAEQQGRSEEAARLYRGILKSLEVLQAGFECRACGLRKRVYFDRCVQCGRWGTCALDIGGPDDESLRSTRPLYAVPEDDSGKVEQDAMA